VLDEYVDVFWMCFLEGCYLYVFFDVKVEKVCDGGCVVGKVLVIVYGVYETGWREIFLIDVGEVEIEVFWIGFLRGFVKCGLVGV